MEFNDYELDYVPSYIQFTPLGTEDGGGTRLEIIL